MLSGTCSTPRPSIPRRFGQSPPWSRETPQLPPVHPRRAGAQHTSDRSEVETKHSSPRAPVPSPQVRWLDPPIPLQPSSQGVVGALGLYEGGQPLECTKSIERRDRFASTEETASSMPASTSSTNTSSSQRRGRRQRWVRQRGFFDPFRPGASAAVRRRRRESNRIETVIDGGEMRPFRQFMISFDLRRPTEINGHAHVK